MSHGRLARGSLLRHGIVTKPLPEPGHISWLAGTAPKRVALLGALDRATGTTAATMGAAIMGLPFNVQQHCGTAGSVLSTASAGCQWQSLCRWLPTWLDLKERHDGLWAVVKPSGIPLS
jgi:hypothetical protein